MEMYQRSTEDYFNIIIEGEQVYENVMRIIYKEDPSLLA